MESPLLKSVLSLLEEDEDNEKNVESLKSLIYDTYDPITVQPPKEMMANMERPNSVPLNNAVYNAPPFIPRRKISSKTTSANCISPSFYQMSSRVKQLVSSPPTYKKSNSTSINSHIKIQQTNNYTVTDLCKDQQGSRRIQTFLTTAKDFEITELFDSIKGDLYELMNDLFGNYVVQKFIELGNDKLRQFVHSIIRGKVVELSKHMYGCRVIQKIIEYSNTNENERIFNEIEKSIIELIEDQNGNHVIQKIIENYWGCIEKILSALQGQIEKYSGHGFGCRVMQRIIEKRDNNFNNQIFQELQGNIIVLSMNQFGNYVIQHLLEFGNDTIREAIINEVEDVFFASSLLKFSSNVMEKCVQFGPSNKQQILIKKLFDCTDDMIYKMMKDPFANYVLQRMFTMMNNDQRLQFYTSYVQRNINSLRKNIYAKHLLNSLDESMK
ncbi:hypothetical protein ENUP19_0248G0116 [Entamoeba nuttalli]|uniref:Pumilio family RNA-binding protein n=2 Tax=Entamoeba nuttalli TaxID=412467 RepID=K2HP12_ENTNP|nr:pumilio family RNA-binding protein [Entamoeba nuttalli P19]EKE37585.1 pumilio family RNA-binding protein [Entamoeba nuttalli P19]|eukprot:XP_008860111.1 pumilio family RNA-binding protein [Entamoeba nuttalli P19]